MKVKKLFKIILPILLLWMTIHIVYSIVDGLRDDGSSADIAVVLGNKVNEDGSLSVRLMERLNCAIALQRVGRIKKVIVSGGLGKEGYYEANKMREFLLYQGDFPDSCIIIDNKGDNTLLTVKNTLALQGQLHFDKLIVISQYYHLTRTKMLFGKEGFNNVSGVSPKYFEWRDIYSLIREFFAFCRELL